MNTYLGSLNNLRPTVNFASHHVAPTQAIWGPRIIPDCQLFYVISGEAELQLGPHTYRLRSGDYGFYGANSPHTLVTLSPAQYFSLHFHMDHDSPVPVHPAYSIHACNEYELTREPTSYVLELHDGSLLTIPHHFAIPGLESIHMRLVSEYQNEKPGHALLLRALLMELLTAIVRHLLRIQPVSHEKTKIEPALTAIEKHPEVNWSVSQLAGLCGYHSVYFASLFGKITGTNPKHYLISERIRKAKYYLLTHEKMEAIAEKLGYSSIHYFSRNFKEQTGLTPTQFKLQNH
jgi:AraC-like DNA-binding protein